MWPIYCQCNYFIKLLKFFDQIVICTIWLEHFVSCSILQFKSHRMFDRIGVWEVRDKMNLQISLFWFQLPEDCFSVHSKQAIWPLRELLIRQDLPSGFFEIHIVTIFMLCKFMFAKHPLNTICFPNLLLNNKLKAQKSVRKGHQFDIVTEEKTEPLIWSTVEI